MLFVAITPCLYKDVQLACYYASLPTLPSCTQIASQEQTEVNFEGIDNASGKIIGFRACCLRCTGSIGAHFFLLPLGDPFLAPSHSVGGPATSLYKKRSLGFATLPRDSFAFVTERFLEKQDALVLLIAWHENTKLSRNSKKLHDNINRSSREGRITKGYSIVMTAKLGEVTDQWPSSALRQDQSLHSDTILASESGLSLSRLAPMPPS